MYRNLNFEVQTITDTGTVYLNAEHNIEDIWEGSVIFTATATNVTGTFDVDVTPQGSLDGVTWVNAGSLVALADTVTAAAPITGKILFYAYYRLKITGADTQSTTVVGQYLAKGRS